MNKLSKNCKSPIVEEAWQKLKKGFPDDALELFNEVLEKDKKDTDALYGRASASFLIDETEKAIKDLTSLLKIEPAHQKAYHLRGLIKGNDKKYKEAIKDLKKAVSLDDSNVEAMIDLGGAYLVEKDYASALAVFEQVAKVDDECVDGIRGMGIVYLFQKKYEKAIEMLGKAIEKDGDDIDSLLAMADAYFATNKPEKGNEFVKKAKRLKKDVFNPKNKFADQDQLDDQEDEDQDIMDADFED